MSRWTSVAADPPAVHCDVVAIGTAQTGAADILRVQTSVGLSVKLRTRAYDATHYETKDDFKIWQQRECARTRINPLRPLIAQTLDIDDFYLKEEAGGACLVCHKQQSKA